MSISTLFRENSVEIDTFRDVRSVGDILEVFAIFRDFSKFINNLVIFANSLGKTWDL